MTQDLLILFITRANSGLERHLVEHLNKVKGYKHALALAEQWEKSKVGLQTPISHIQGIAPFLPLTSETESGTNDV